MRVAEFAQLKVKNVLLEWNICNRSKSLHDKIIFIVVLLKEAKASDISVAFGYNFSANFAESQWAFIKLYSLTNTIWQLS